MPRKRMYQQNQYQENALEKMGNGRWWYPEYIGFSWVNYSECDVCSHFTSTSNCLESSKIHDWKICLLQSEKLLLISYYNESFYGHLSLGEQFGSDLCKPFLWAWGFSRKYLNLFFTNSNVNINMISYSHRWNCY